MCRRVDPRRYEIHLLFCRAVGSVRNMTQVTRLLDAASQDDGAAAQELLPPVYAELRRLAAQKMAHEAKGQTLQPTALVHEAWLKLAGSS